MPDDFARMTARNFAFQRRCRFLARASTARTKMICRKRFVITTISGHRCRLLRLLLSTPPLKLPLVKAPAERFSICSLPPRFCLTRGSAIRYHISFLSRRGCRLRAMHFAGPPRQFSRLSGRHHAAPGYGAVIATYDTISSCISRAPAASRSINR